MRILTILLIGIPILVMSIEFYEKRSKRQLLTGKTSSKMKTLTAGVV